jgi:hypothetical protein
LTILILVFSIKDTVVFVPIGRIIVNEMNIEAKKIEIIAQIVRLADYSVLMRLESILQFAEKNADEWQLLSSEEREKVEIGYQSMQAGRVVSNADAKKMIDEFIESM